MDETANMYTLTLQEANSQRTLLSYIPVLMPYNMNACSSGVERAQAACNTAGRQPGRGRSQTGLPDLLHGPDWPRLQRCHAPHLARVLLRQPVPPTGAGWAVRHRADSAAGSACIRCGLHIHNPLPDRPFGCTCFWYNCLLNCSLAQYFSFGIHLCTLFIEF